MEQLVCYLVYAAAIIFLVCAACGMCAIGVAAALEAIAGKSMFGGREEDLVARGMAGVLAGMTLSFSCIIVVALMALLSNGPQSVAKIFG